jgi:hypothetical protein
LDTIPTIRVLNGATPSRDMTGVLHGACVPAVAVRGDAWDDVGGMDGRFEGHAPEVTAFRRKLTILYGDPPKPEGGIFELSAPRFGRPNRRNNDALYAREYKQAKTARDVRAIIGRTHV